MDIEELKAGDIAIEEPLTRRKQGFNSNSPSKLSKHGTHHDKKLSSE